MTGIQRANSTQRIFFRYWEIDALRGFALVLMGIFHTLFDLKYFGKTNVWELRDLPQSFWDIFSTCIATLFLYVVGVSAHIRLSKQSALPFWKQIQPAWKVLGAALLITAATWVFNPRLPIYFGILHCIGVSILVMPLSVRWHPILNFTLGVVMISVGAYFLENVHVQNPIWIWAALKPDVFPMGDYFPVIPWGGIVILGVFSSQVAKIPHREQILPPLWQKSVVSRSFCWLGRHSLIIYLVHQPVLLGFFWVCGWILL